MKSILLVNFPNRACGARAYFFNFHVIFVNTLLHNYRYIVYTIYLFCKVYFTKCTFFAFFFKKICIYQKKVVPLHRETNKDQEFLCLTYS